MANEIVKNWFADQFESLHPMLQELHLSGGRLVGDVDISYGSGLAGILGARVARKMQLPAAGVHQLTVDIWHDQDALHWGRCFNDETIVYSLFRPVGTKAGGYWIEDTGSLSLRLTVDIKDGGWYWRCLSVRFLGVPVPSWLAPKTDAWKIIENGKYRFYVKVSLPFVGNLFSYQGLLESATET